MTRENSLRHQGSIDFGQLTWAGILIGAGVVLWLAGVLLGSAAVASAAKQWIRQLDQPPKELAKMNWQRFKSAKSAGTEAWRNGSHARLSAMSNP